MQYVGWIRDSAQHVLIGNPFQTSGGSANYFQPGLVISGLITRLGVAAWLSYLLWTPIAAIALFLAARAYVRRLLPGTASRRCALILSLFYISPLAELATLSHWNQTLFFESYGREMWPGFYLWGYPFTALAIALMMTSLMAYERDRKDRKVRVWGPLCALLCALLQPWQGATLIVLVGISELWLRWKRDERSNPRLPIAFNFGAAIPLGYYFALSHVDASWSLSGRINRLEPLPIDDLLLTMLPLAACGVLAYWVPANTSQSVALRAWPIAAIGVFLTIDVAHVGTFPKHSLQGLSIPFAVLAVTGAGRLPWGSSVTRVMLGSVLVAALVGPSLARELNMARGTGEPTILGAEPFFIRSSEQAALNFLEGDPSPGAVLAPVFLGQIVPAETGRNTWVGIASWTPNYAQRTIIASQLFAGGFTAATSISIVRSSGVRFLLSDCQSQVDLTSRLRPILQSEKHFGCATVYTLRRSAST